MEPTEADILKAKITLETASIRWRELQRFFAAGKAIAVTPELDLVEVAAELAADNRQRLEQWLQNQRVAPVNDTQASAWYEADAKLWAVVVAPWVLVQAAPE